MKYILPLVLSVVFILSGCAADKGDVSDGSIADPQDSSATPVAELAPVVNEYGEPDSLIDNGSMLHGYIMFPKTGSDNIDKTIRGWAESEYAKAQEEVEALYAKDDSAEGEINIQYNSYRVLDDYAGIEEIVFFSNSGMAHPRDFYKTFNIDLNTNKLLKNEDIINPKKVKDVLAILVKMIKDAYPEATVDPEDGDASWLDNIVLNHEGIDVLLPRGEMLPSYLGALKFNIPYETLGDAFILNQSPVPQDKGDAPKEENTGSNAPAQEASGNIDPDKPMIALTFDDGPSKYTEQILAALNENGGRATFCVVGNRVGNFEDVLTQIKGQGSQIIGHSWDHKQLTKLTEAEIRKELQKTNTSIYDAAGVEPKMYRPPYGAANDVVKSISKELGMSLINWSVDTEDWKSKNADAVYKSIMKDAKDGSIILCHDLYESTAKAMKRVIPELVKQGYQLVTVEELLSASGKEIEPGKVYFEA